MIVTTAAVPPAVVPSSPPKRSRSLRWASATRSLSPTRLWLSAAQVVICACQLSVGSCAPNSAVDRPAVTPDALPDYLETAEREEKVQLSNGVLSVPSGYEVHIDATGGLGAQAWLYGYLSLNAIDLVNLERPGPEDRRISLLLSDGERARFTAPADSDRKVYFEIEGVKVSERPFEDILREGEVAEVRMEPILDKDGRLLGATVGDLPHGFSVGISWNRVDRAQAGSAPAEIATRAAPSDLLAEIPDGAKKVELQQGVAFDPGFLMTAERYVRIGCPAALTGAGAFLKERIKDRQNGKTQVQVHVDRENATRLRLRVAGAKSEVLRRHSYWELIFIDAFLARDEMPLEQSISMGELQSRFDPSSDLYRKLGTLQNSELSVVVSGRYKAGGRPSSEQGYENDFRRDNFLPELEDYAAQIVEELRFFFTSRYSEFDARTGRAKVRRDLLLADDC